MEDPDLSILTPRGGVGTCVEVGTSVCDVMTVDRSETVAVEETLVSDECKPTADCGVLREAAGGGATARPIGWKENAESTGVGGSTLGRPGI